MFGAPIARALARVCIDSTCLHRAETEAIGGRFYFNQVFEYLNDGSYPDGFDKNDKRTLRKRANFFAVKDTELHYTSGEFLAI